MDKVKKSKSLKSYIDHKNGKVDESKKFQESIKSQRDTRTRMQKVKKKGQ
jgi:hypothetical protein